MLSVGENKFRALIWSLLSDCRKPKTKTYRIPANQIEARERTGYFIIICLFYVDNVPCSNPKYQLFDRES